MWRFSLVALMLSGCFNPDDIFPLIGSVTSTESPSGQRVQLLREEQGRCDEPRAFKATTTDEAGAYRFELFRAQTQRLTDFGSFCFRVQAGFSSGTVSSLNLNEVFSEQQLMPLPDWNPALDWWNGELEFAPVRTLEAGEDEARVVHRFELMRDGEVAWRVDDVEVDRMSGEAKRVRPRIDDDAVSEFSGWTQMRARILSAPRVELNPFGNPDDTVVEVTAGEHLEALLLEPTPPSRGAWCPGLPLPCTLTDGALTPVELGGIENVRVQVPGIIPRAVVLRGVETQTSLMSVVLTNGQGEEQPPIIHAITVSAFNYGDARFFVIPLEVTYEVTQVRVVFPSGVQRISEVSVW